jgi:hypothetical protein
MPFATLYVLATDAEGNATLSHFMCDACQMTFGQEPAESSDDDDDVDDETVSVKSNIESVIETDSE